MQIRAGQWIAALCLAILAHLGIAYWFYNPNAAPQPLLQRGIAVSLAPAGSSPGQTITATTVSAPTVKPVPAKIVKAVEPEMTEAVELAPSPTVSMTNASLPRSNSKKSKLRTRPVKKPPVTDKPLLKPATAPPQKSSNQIQESSNQADKSHSTVTGNSLQEAANSRGETPDKIQAAPMPGNPMPRYPRIARSRGYQGRTILEIFVLPDGTVDHVRIKQSSGHDILDRAALEAVKRWRFRPAKRNGRPISATLVVPVTFRLNEG